MILLKSKISETNYNWLLKNSVIYKSEEWQSFRELKKYRFQGGRHIIVIDENNIEHSFIIPNTKLPHIFEDGFKIAKITERIYD